SAISKLTHRRKVGELWHHLSWEYPGTKCPGVRAMMMRTGRGPTPRPARNTSLLSGLRLDGSLDLLFHGLQIEARAPLHGRELDRSLGDFCHLLLHDLEAPELVDKPIVIADRPAILAVEHTRPLERVQTEIDQDRPVHFDRGAEPATRLIGEAVLVIVDPYRGERALGAVEDFVALRRAFAGDQVHLVVAVKVDLVVAIAELLTLLQFLGDIRVARCGDKGWEPVEA